MNLNTLRPLYPQSTETPLSAVQVISLHLLLHRPVGEKDSLDPGFGPYISTLPRDFSSHPLTWLVNRPRKAKKTTEELFLSNLPPSVLNALHTLYARFLEDYQTICLYLVSVVPMRWLIPMHTCRCRTDIAKFFRPRVARRPSFLGHMDNQPRQPWWLTIAGPGLTVLSP